MTSARALGPRAAYRSGIFGALLLIAATGGATPRAAKPPDLGAVIDRVFADVRGPDSPGCAVAVTRAGAITFQRGYGAANLEDGVPITAETIFDVGSVSKQFTSASVVLLAARGKLDLGADVHTYLKDLPDYGKVVTLRHLLTHSSGLPDPYEIAAALTGDTQGNFYPSEFTLQLLRRMANLRFDPGTRFEYSNAGYLLLAQVVEHAAGQSLRQFALQNFFAPLGMTHTHFHDDHRELVRGRARGYDAGPNGWRVSDSNFEVVGDGGLYTTVGDLAKWHAALRAGTVAGGRELVSAMERVTSYPAGRPVARGPLEGIDFGYGFGLMTWRFGDQKAVGHLGGWVGFSTAEARFPARDHSVVVACNFRTTTALPRMRAVADAVLAASGGDPGADPMQGLYGNTLIATLPDGREVRVLYDADRTFSYSDGTRGHWFRNDAGDLCQIDPNSGDENPTLCNPMRADLRPGAAWEQEAANGMRVRVRVIAGRQRVR